MRLVGLAAVLGVASAQKTDPGGTQLLPDAATAEFEVRVASCEDRAPPRI